MTLTTAFIFLGTLGIIFTIAAVFFLVLGGSQIKAEDNRKFILFFLGGFIFMIAAIGIGTVLIKTYNLGLAAPIAVIEDNAIIEVLANAPIGDDKALTIVKFPDDSFRMFELDVATSPGIYKMVNQNGQRHLWPFPDKKSATKDATKEE